jgi:pilus assembly protein CpaE
VVSLDVFLIGSRDRQLETTLRAIAPDALATGGLELLSASVSAAKPRVVIVDLRGDSGVPPSIAAIRRNQPTTGIIVVAASMDPAMMLEAMRAGVTEFLTEPLSADELRAAIDRVRKAGVPATPDGRLYAFVGAKGGVGTTTVAVNVSTALRHATGTRVLLIDLHPAYGDAALFFGAEPRFSVLDALENTHRLDEAFLQGLVLKTKAGVDLLASSERSMVTPVEVVRVKALIDFVRGRYAHVVLDVPRSDAAILDSLDDAVKVVIVANQELSTVRGAARMATALRQRYGKDHVQVVVSRYDSVSEIAQEDIERVTGGSVRHTFPSNYRVALDALNKGRPLVTENHNKLAASFVAFAKALAGVKSPAEPSEARAGLLGRLTGRR